MTQNTPAWRGLARFINVPDGISFDRAEKRAQRRLVSFQPRMIEHVDASIEMMGRFLGSLSGEPTPIQRAELYQLAYEIASVAGSAGFSNVSVCARLLCELMDLFDNGKAWDAPAVEVHYHSLRVLRAPREPIEEQRIIAGLVRVRARIAGG